MVGYRFDHSLLRPRCGNIQKRHLRVKFNHRRSRQPSVWFVYIASIEFDLVSLVNGATMTPPPMEELPEGKPGLGPSKPYLTLHWRAPRFVP